MDTTQPTTQLAAFMALNGDLLRIFLSWHIDGRVRTAVEEA